LRLWRIPLDSDTAKQPRADVHFIPPRCKGCELCVTYCPTSALSMTDQLSSRGYHLPALADPQACVGCGLCELMCPEFAIFMEPVPDE
jgi:2-oxoglutarate ferredoxin oxidoreductase subunit delta